MSDQRGYTIREFTAADLDQARAVMYRSVVEDFGSQPDPGIHADVDDLLGWYTAPDGPFMLVAQDDATGAIIATGGIRGGALKEGLSPGHLVRRYRDGRTGQIVRVYVLREQRRRGIARAMVQAILDRAAAEGHYDRIVFHTLQHSPGAVAFWTSMGATLVLDDTDGVSNAMFYEFTTPNGPGAGRLLQSASTTHPIGKPTRKARNLTVTKRRDMFIFVANPDKAEEARAYLSDWLRELDGHPGYLGGAVLKESAGEQLDNTLVLTLDFESTEAARTLWPKIENTINPLYPDDKSDKSPDQGTAFFNGTKDAIKAGEPLPLKFTRGNGLLARMLHIHAEAIDEFTAAR